MSHATPADVVDRAVDWIRRGLVRAGVLSEPRLIPIPVPVDRQPRRPR